MYIIISYSLGAGSTSYYLCQGFMFHFVCSIRITQNSVTRCHTGHGRNNKIFVVIRSRYVRLWVVLVWLSVVTIIHRRIESYSATPVSQASPNRVFRFTRRLFDSKNFLVQRPWQTYTLY